MLTFKLAQIVVASIKPKKEPNRASKKVRMAVAILGEWKEALGRQAVKFIIGIPFCRDHCSDAADAARFIARERETLAANLPSLCAGEPNELRCEQAVTAAALVV